MVATMLTFFSSSQTLEFLIRNLLEVCRMAERVKASTQNSQNREVESSRPMLRKGRHMFRLRCVALLIRVTRRPTKDPSAGGQGDLRGRGG